MPSANTTCETKPANFAEIVSNVDTNMFQHVMGNDPRPHYFHQPNIMGSPPPGPPTPGTPPATSKNVGDGLFYSVLNPLLEQYNKYFSAPIEQPTMAQIGQLLAEQQTWSAAVNTGQVSGYIEGNQVTVNNSGACAINAPLTGDHRRWFGLRRSAVRLDERADRDKHAHDPSDLAGSRESHDSEPATGQCAIRLLSDTHGERGHGPLYLVAQQRLASRGADAERRDRRDHGHADRSGGLELHDQGDRLDHSDASERDSQPVDHGAPPPTDRRERCCGVLHADHSHAERHRQPQQRRSQQMRIRIRHHELLRVDSIVRLAAGVGLEPCGGIRVAYEPHGQHHLPLQDLGDERRRHEQRR